MARLFQLPRQVPIVSGAVSPGAKANFFLTGTTTRTDTFTDDALGTPHANPVIADAAGVFAAIYLDPKIDYKLTLDDTNDALIYTDDPVIDTLVRPTVTFTSGDATPTIAKSRTFITAGTTTITDFDDGKVGDTIHIEANSTITIFHNASILSLQGNASYNMLDGDTLALHMFVDQIWQEISRSPRQNFSQKATSFTNTLLKGESGKTIFLDLVGGGSTVLPAVEQGLNFTFIVITAPTTAYTIDTPSGANIMSGVVLDIVGELVYATARDIISFVASTSVIGDRLDIVCDGINWYYKAFSGADGGITTGQT